MASLCGSAHEPQLIAAAQTSAEMAKLAASSKSGGAAATNNNNAPTLAASDALAKRAPRILDTLLAKYKLDSRVSHGW